MDVYVYGCVYVLQGVATAGAGHRASLDDYILIFVCIYTHTDVYKYDCVNVVRVCIWVCVSLDVYILVCT